MTCSRIPSDVLERLDIPDADELLLVDPSNRPTNCKRQSLCAPCRWSDDEKNVIDEVLDHRDIHLDQILCFVRAALHLTGNAHDLSHHRWLLRRSGRPQ